VVVAEAPLSVTLAMPSGGAIGRNHVDLSWSTSVDSEFASYVVMRSLVANASWQDAVAVVEISEVATTIFTDIALSPKTTYYYRIFVENSAGMHAVGNEVSVTTLPGMDYPFLDTGEAGGGIWSAPSPWALSEEDAWSATHAWSDSPGGDYADGLAGLSLTLSAPMDLAGATRPVLSFVHQIALDSGDNALVEISSDNGATWSALETFSSADNTVGWLRQRINLDAYKLTDVLVRFRLTTNVSGTSDGWHLDEISVAEQPDALSAPVVDLVSYHGFCG